MTKHGILNFQKVHGTKKNGLSLTDSSEGNVIKIFAEKQQTAAENTA